MNRLKNPVEWFKQSKIRVILIAAVILFSAATIFAAASSSYNVTIYKGDEVKTMTTMRTDAKEVLAQADIEIADDDIINLDNFSSGTASVIRIYPACTIKIYDDSNKCTEYKANGLVEDALKQCGITLLDGDVISCDKDIEIYDGMAIVITRAYPILISADGKVTKVNLATGTVSDALDKAVIAVDDDDIISKPLDTPLAKGMSIKITRVEYKERQETSVVKFTTKTEKDASLFEDQYKIKQQGVDGEKITTYRDKYVEGKLTESTSVKTEVTKEPVEQIKLVGTKSRGYAAAGIKTVSWLTPPSDLKLNGTVPTSYKKKIVGTASAYSGGGITSTGRSAQPGYIAVNPNQIPYHTKMWIVSNDGAYVYGYASAEDTGGFIYWSGSRSTLCDLYFPTESSASAFGRRSITIYVL